MVRQRTISELLNLHFASPCTQMTISLHFVKFGDISRNSFCFSIFATQGSPLTRGLPQSGPQIPSPGSTKSGQMVRQRTISELPDLHFAFPCTQMTISLHFVKFWDLSRKSLFFDFCDPRVPPDMAATLVSHVGRPLYFFENPPGKSKKHIFFLHEKFTRKTLADRHIY